MLSEMTDPPGQFDHLDEVLRLVTALADSILEAQISNRPIPHEQFSALVSAAQLLHDHDVPWPPLVEQVLSELGERLSRIELAPEAASAEPERNGLATGLTRFLGAFRRKKGTAHSHPDTVA